VIRRIRENPRLASLPVVAVTAYAMRGDREKILKSGFDGYLSKPLSPSSLTAELDRLLTKNAQSANQDQYHGGQPAGKDRAAGASSSGT
jgi:CheY-like chemotaxis protein